jgi:PAS domain S-box-containing protein
MKTMNHIEFTALMFLSTALQLSAVVLSLRMLLFASRHHAWFLLAAGMILMAIRRVYILVHFLTAQPQQAPDFLGELVALFTSLLVVIGIAKISPLFLSLKRSTELLKESEERFRLLFQDVPLAYQSLDEHGHIIDVNQAWLDTLGYSRNEIIGQWFGNLLTPKYAAHFGECFSRFKSEGEIHNIEVEMIHQDSSRLVAVFDGKVGYDANGTFKQMHCMLSDITERRRVLAEKDQLIGELQNAITQIKQLKGLLPICASCKKIRDDRGYWQQLEVYIREHTEAEFSHGLCPECAEKLYPGFCELSNHK